MEGSFALKVPPRGETVNEKEERRATHTLHSGFPPERVARAPQLRAKK